MRNNKKIFFYIKSWILKEIMNICTKQRIHVQNQYKSAFSTESKRFLQKHVRSYNNLETLYDSEQITEGLQKIPENLKILQKPTTYNKTHAGIMILCTRTGPRQDHDRTTTGPRQQKLDHDRTTTGPRQDHDRYFKPDLGLVLDPRWLPILCDFCFLL